MPRVTANSRSSGSECGLGTSATRDQHGRSQHPHRRVGADLVRPEHVGRICAPGLVRGRSISPDRLARSARVEPPEPPSTPSRASPGRRGATPGSPLAVRQQNIRHSTPERSQTVKLLADCSMLISVPVVLIRWSRAQVVSRARAANPSSAGTWCKWLLTGRVQCCSSPPDSFARLVWQTAAKTRSDESNPLERGYPTASPWPALSIPAPELDPVAAAWGRKLYPGSGAPRVAAPGLMFGLHHHQEAAGLHHHHQPRGPSLKEEPLTATRAWMQPTVPDQNG